MNPTLRLAAAVAAGVALIGGAAVAVRPPRDHTPPSPAVVTAPAGQVTVVTVQIDGDYVSAMAIVHSDAGPALLDIGVPTPVTGFRGAVLSVLGASPGHSTCRILYDAQVGDEETATDGGHAVCMVTAPLRQG